MKSLNIPAGHTFLMMGTASGQGLKEPVEKPKFLEDLSAGEVNVAVCTIDGAKERSV